ncbi:hypothetical protein [Halopseudomonas yangmingensis]|uniref:hypothetical protein n=1 Tax=Halopseudomonas yangmingensis TaxID=1720063 RepID=UPI001FDEE79C|nr:hypothetical protein [Halopseudomonas yangmingensis]
MEYPPFTKQADTDTRAFTFTDVGTELKKQRFNVAPLDIAADGAAEYLLQSPAVLLFHAWMVLNFGAIDNLSAQPPPQPGA